MRGIESYNASKSNLTIVESENSYHDCRDPPIYHRITRLCILRNRTCKMNLTTFEINELVTESL